MNSTKVTWYFIQPRTSVFDSGYSNKKKPAHEINLMIKHEWVLHTKIMVTMTSRGSFFTLVTARQCNDLSMITAQRYISISLFYYGIHWISFLTCEDLFQFIYFWCFQKVNYPICLCSSNCFSMRNICSVKLEHKNSRCVYTNNSL